MRILVVNAGSSSLKLGLIEDGKTLALVDVPASRARLDEERLQRELAALDRIDAVGHRIVHGGAQFREPILIDDRVVTALHDLAELAPLHQEKSLSALRAVSARLPDAPGVACFDTAFHADIPAAAATYAIPAEWRERWSLRRYGFHGLSHAYATRAAAHALGGVPHRLLTCHLGAGASLAAVLDGRSVDTTMGFTPLEGLVMATRSGSVGPGLLLWLLEREGLSGPEMAQALEHESGLLALAGTSDMREIVQAATGGDDRARLAFAVYIHRLCAEAAAMAAALGGLDAMTFSGGVGENSSAVRQAVAEGLGFLGVAVGAEANASATGSADITAPDATVRVLVIPAREDLEIARGVRAVLEGPPAA